MKSASLHKYQPFHKKFPMELADRRWPDAFIEKAPTWCSVDLRDGNQALPIPMNIEEKLEYFQMLCAIGFKEIEVGFPSASETEFRFVRHLVETQAIPKDVTIGVLVQAREHLIRRTFASLEGTKQAIVHVYNATSRLQRKVTFGNASKEAIKAIAVKGVRLAKHLASETTETKIRLEYSPESFSDTETDYALEVCEAVMDAWEPSVQNPIILNLPLTVEWTTPNVHADQIEWLSRNLQDRDKAIISLHTHNDRGTGVAATELGLLAGAERVEGTLFGNGERTGNLDIVTVALNMNSHGIETGLDFSDLKSLRQVYERVTRMEIHERHPYVGNLVFAAFSGSHQDAIKKGMDLARKRDGEAPGLWEVPYLTIDPKDIGRTYEAIIRINSQSGKGGVAWVIQQDHDLDLPKTMHPEVGLVVNALADARGIELNSEAIWEAFSREFVNRQSPLELTQHQNVTQLTEPEGLSPDHSRYAFSIQLQGQAMEITGSGNGPINALAHALKQEDLKAFKVTDYRSQAIGRGSAADAAAFVQIQRERDGQLLWGCGIDPSIQVAGLRALISAINRAQILTPHEA